jgi:hypothetical protein
MFKEKATEKLIEYIQSLPNEEQTLIAQRIVKTKNKKGKKVTKRNSKAGIKKMGAFLDRLGNKLPENYKFNREEANER